MNNKIIYSKDDQDDLSTISSKTKKKENKNTFHKGILIENHNIMEHEESSSENTDETDNVEASNSHVAHNRIRFTFLDSEIVQRASEVQSTRYTVASLSSASENVPVHDLSIEFPKVNPLLEIDIAAFSSIIQESLYYFETLKYTLDVNKEFRYTENYETIDEKYGVDKELEFLFRDEARLSPLIPKYSQKLMRETNYLIDVFQKTMTELQDHGRYESLEHEVNKTVKWQINQKRMELDCHTWSEVAEEIQNVIKSNKFNFSKEIDELTNKIQKMNSNINEMKFEILTKIEYIKKWEVNRVKQQKYLALLQEEELKKKIANYEKLEENEEIIYNRLTEHLQNYNQEIEKKIPEWNTKYNDEFEKLQHDIVYLQEDIKKQKKEIEDLIVLKNERQKLIDECNEEREKRRLRREHEALLNTSASKIQAQWRGFMVRHRLGRYNDLFTKLKNRKEKKKRKKVKNKLKKII